MTVDEFREMAFRFPGVAEAPCYGTPGFRVRKKLLARLREDGETLALKVDLYQRDHLLVSEPDVFFLTDHYVGYPYVLVRLGRVEPSRLEELVEQAWRAAAPRRLLAEYGG